MNPTSLVRTPLGPWGAAVVVGLAAVAGAADVVRAAPGAAPAPAVDLPGPAPRARLEGADAAAANAACAACHVAIAAEWEGSMHRQSWADPVFQEAYDIEPLPFCRGCHAPESDPEVFPTAAAQDVGVACTTCHVQEMAAGDVVVGAHGAPGAPHTVLADARMATAAACGSCHQFDFPRVPGAPMQSTLSEHAASSFAGEPCQSCHMPSKEAGGRRWRSHAFAVIDDPGMVRRAATARAERDGPRALRVTIEPRGAGHAFPTGDMFRRLEVRAIAVDPSGREVARAEPVHLGRTFSDRPHGGPLALERVEIADTRIPPPGAGPGREVVLRFPRSVAGAEVRWQLAYQRMPTAMAASFGVEQALDEIVVTEGAIPPAGAAGRAAGAPREERGR
jgi:hypothetical protein